jgi:hypothetical protein
LFYWNFTLNTSTGYKNIHQVLRGNNKASVERGGLRLYIHPTTSCVRSGQRSLFKWPIGKKPTKSLKSIAGI